MLLSFVIVHGWRAACRRANDTENRCPTQGNDVVLAQQRASCTRTASTSSMLLIQTNRVAYKKDSRFTFTLHAADMYPLASACVLLIEIERLVCLLDYIHDDIFMCVCTIIHNGMGNHSFVVSQSLIVVNRNSAAKMFDVPSKKLFHSHHAIIKIDFVIH